MKKKWIILAIIGVLLVVAALAGVKTLQIRAMIDQGKKMVPPPETVTATAAKSEVWSTSLTAVGSLTAVQGVTVAAELAGKVVNIGFTPGGYVKKGDLLVSQDTTSEQAQLMGALAQAELTRTTLQRDVKMLAEKIISQADYDQAVATREQALAQAENIRTTINKKTIRAPFNGRLGIRQVNLGQTLREGDAIVTLQNLDPIFVDFALPQQNLARLQKDQKVRITCDAFPDLTTSGTITTINPVVDADTRNVKLQATIENRRERLRPRHVRQRGGGAADAAAGGDHSGNRGALRTLWGFRVPGGGRSRSAGEGCTGWSPGPGGNRQGVAPAVRAPGRQARGLRRRE